MLRIAVNDLSNGSIADIVHFRPKSSINFFTINCAIKTLQIAKIDCEWSVTYAEWVHMERTNVYNYYYLRSFSKGEERRCRGEQSYFSNWLVNRRISAIRTRILVGCTRINLHISMRLLTEKLESRACVCDRFEMRLSRLWAFPQGDR